MVKYEKKFLFVLILTVLHKGSYQAIDITNKLDRMTYLEDAALVPDDVHQIRMVEDVASLEHCLLECNKKGDCLTIVYEEKVCYLYNTNRGEHQKTPGQQVVTVTIKDQISFSNVCEKTVPCQNGGICTSLPTDPYYKCQCIGAFGGDNCEKESPIIALHAPIKASTLSNGTVVDLPTENGWIVLMRRQDGSVDFTSKTWQDYKVGFGNLAGEFWLGNEWIHLLTTEASYTLRVDLIRADGLWYDAMINHFWIGPEDDQYRLYMEGYSGYLPDKLVQEGSSCSSKGALFYTPDRNARCCCGGWWFTSCCEVSLTGYYVLNKDSEDNIHWEGFSSRVTYADMKIRLNN